MSLLGEEVVEEWLNRNGYFTIRGIKVGKNEIDILAIKPLPNGQHDRRHIEIQLSITPIGYVTGQGLKKRSDAELRERVHDWIEKKYSQPSMEDLRQRLCPGNWTRELVIGNVKYETEIVAFKEAGVIVHRLRDILLEMAAGNTVVRSATGADLLDLMRMLVGDGPRPG